MRQSFPLHVADLFVSLAVSSCTAGDPSELQEPRGEPTRLIRLSERLADAEIQSPLIDIEAADFASLQDVKAEPVFAESFDRFEPKRVNWSPTAGCSAVKKPNDRGRALLYNGRNGHRCVFVVPAQPSTHYRLSRSIRTRNPEIDLKVMESRLRLRHPERLNHRDDLARVAGGKFPSMRELLYVHRFMRPTPDETWQQSAVHIVTTPLAKSFVIAVNDAQAFVSHSGRQTWLDDIVVEKLEPTREQELALLKRADLAPGADPRLGLHKHAQFLPVADAATVAPPNDANYAYRDGLLAPAPTTIAFDLRIPREARLRLSVGMFKMSRTGDAATFRVRIASGAQQETLLERTLAVTPRFKDWRWHQVSADLHTWAGKRVRLTLETTAPATSRGLAVWSNPVITSQRRAGDPPNVILIAADTLRADRLSAYGYRRRTSIAIDRLAADGVLFKDVVSPSNWTSPAFASLFTGMLPSRHQVVHRARSIPERLDTLAEHFRDAGWTTYGIAYKAYLYNMGYERGFDSFFNIPRPSVTADTNLARALAWLDAHGDERFFLFLHFNDPHQPFNQPAPFERRFNTPAALARLGAELPLTVEPTGGVLGCRKCRRSGNVVPAFKKLGSELYDGEVAYLDDRIGAFLDALRERGLYDEALIAFVADHGEMMWEAGEFFGHGGAYLRQELVQVPLIIKPPRRSVYDLGTTVGTVVRSHDLMPTLLDLAGLRIDSTLDAQSLELLMRGESEAEPRIAISENLKQSMLSIRLGRWKYVLHHPLGERTRERLHDLETDPTEKRAFNAAQQGEVDTMRAVAMRHFLTNRRGYYVLVLGDGTMRYHEVTLRAATAIRSPQALLGLGQWNRRSSPVVRYKGDSNHPIVLLSRFDGAVPSGIAVTIRAEPGAHFEKLLRPEAFVPFDEAAIAPDENEAPVRLFAFRVGEPVAENDEPRAVSAEQLGALEALGYVR